MKVKLGLKFGIWIIDLGANLSHILEKKESYMPSNAWLEINIVCNIQRLVFRISLLKSLSVFLCLMSNWRSSLGFELFLVGKKDLIQYWRKKKEKNQTVKKMDFFLIINTDFNEIPIA